MKQIFFYASLLFALSSCASSEAQCSDSSIEVVAHRGDWRNYPENSLEGIQSCIEMGIDMVEIDLAMTKDSVLILMHDKTIDRTTTGKGRPADYTLAEIKQLYLRSGMGYSSELFRVPTLEEVMLVTKGKIRVNLDKADKYFDAVYHILVKTGTLDEVVIKSSKPYEDLFNQFGANLTKMEFMPVVKIRKETTMESLKPLLDMRYGMYELVFKEENKEVLLAIKAELEGTESKIWINSLWNSLCAGYSDNRATLNPDATWGYLIDTLGASVIQTDRPEQLIAYLKN